MRRLNQKDGPETNWSDKIKAFNGLNDGSLSAFLDTSAGLTYADKACIWARHLCVQAGVKFVLGPKEGRLDDLVYAPTTHVPKGEKKVVGIKTVDGKVHDADVVVVACELPSNPITVTRRRTKSGLVELILRRTMDTQLDP